MIKAVLIDFDGTLVYKDILDVVCGIAGKEKESARINKDFHAGKADGLTSLVKRINFLKGISLPQIQRKLGEKTYITPGAKELLEFLNQDRIVSILNSGNIIPVLSYYQKLLDITYIVGTYPKMKSNVIMSISKKDFPEREFKLAEIKKILKNLSISAEETLAIGDSPADKKIFAFAGKSIAINPKNGIEKCADYVIADSLANAIPIITELNS